jgi:ATPase subunit of ABC transporter with duplicated ATPase domains
MTRVVCEDLSFGFSSPLFEGLSCTFDVGFTGLVGANGAGKTTLLRLIAGELVPHAGRVRLAPQGSVVWCRQESREQLEELRDFAADDSKRARRWRGALEIQPDQLQRFAQLSSGERKRWQLAFALAQEPDVLLLDEPTNHLDRSARALIGAALRRFPGTAILVSHDRTLLDGLTTRTLRLGGAAARSFPGNYSAAQAEWESLRRATEHDRSELRQAEARLAQRAAERRRRAESAERDRSTSRRMKDEHDHDARGMLAKNRAESAGRRLAREAAAIESRVSRVRQELGALHVDKQLGRDLFVDYVPWSKPIVLRVSFGGLTRDGRRLLGPTSLDIARADRVVLVAPNGAGKTSLIAELERQNPKVFERSVYLPQSLGPGESERLAARLMSLDRTARGRVLGFVAALGSDPDAVLRSPAWSPGQARKVALALGMAEHAPALILDEPTNHFDLPSIERLERLLCEFPGAIVCVTHDEVLAERVATRLFGIEEQQLVERRLEPQRQVS